MAGRAHSGIAEDTVLYGSARLGLRGIAKSTEKLDCDDKLPVHADHGVGRVWLVEPTARLGDGGITAPTSALVSRLLRQ